VLEVESPVVQGDAKAWWVPRRAILGAWRQGVFIETAELRRQYGPLLTGIPKCRCDCDLRALVDEEYDIWRSTFRSPRAESG